MSENFRGDFLLTLYTGVMAVSVPVTAMQQLTPVYTQHFNYRSFKIKKNETIKGTQRAQTSDRPPSCTLTKIIFRAKIASGRPVSVGLLNLVKIS